MRVPMTPSRILKRAVKLYPNKVAVVDGEIRLTYAEVQKRVNQRQLVAIFVALCDISVT